MKYYIYTVPKAGTYFMAELFEQLGLLNSGWHLDVFFYLDTKAHNMSTNTKTPTATEVHFNYVNRMRKIKDNQFCFGHLAPTYFPLPISRNTAVIFCFRDPKEVVVSEFIDFRFRRTDIPSISRKKIPDDKAAFEAYLKNRGPGIRNEFINILLYNKVTNMSEYQELIAHNCIIKVDFADMRNLTSGINKTKEIVKTLKIKAEVTEALYQRVLDADTKTNSKDVDSQIDRESLWTPKAKENYKALNLEEIYLELKQL